MNLESLNNPLFLTAISGCGVAIIGFIYKRIVKKDDAPPAITSTSEASPVQTNNVTVNFAQPSKLETTHQSSDSMSTTSIKRNTNILFIDDDNKFKIIPILKRNGWEHTKIKKDITSFDDPEVTEARIFFVDINGVGLALEFQDQGLGLAKALKKRFPNKSVVIYSSESSGNRFDEALRLADDFLPKHSEPMRFLEIVEAQAEKYSG